MAATMMRRILVDHARAIADDKRGGSVTRVGLDDSIAAAETNVDLLLLEISAATVKCDWAMAKAWLFHEWKQF